MRTKDKKIKKIIEAQKINCVKKISVKENESDAE